MTRDEKIERVLDVIAPVLNDKRVAIFEWGHETTPTLDELRELAGRIVDALE